MILNLDKEKYRRWSLSKDLTRKSAADSMREMCERAPGIGIVGDYDVDGICGAYIAESGFKEMFPDKPIKTRLPHRFSDGYGLNPAIVEEVAGALPKGSIIVTVDNGISATEGIKKAKELGMSVIITDHHLAPDVLPEADLIFDTKVEGKNPFAYDGYCGAAVIYNLLRPFISDRLKKELSAYAALATICDVMPLTESNWKNVKDLIDRIQNRDIPEPLSLLLDTHGDVFEYANEATLNYSIGPIINTQGRLKDAGAEDVLEYFRHPDADTARDFNELNNERCQLCRDAMDEITKMLGDNPTETPLWVLASGVPQGLAGILAGRLAEKYKRPAIVAVDTDTTDVYAASARTYGDYNLYDYLHDMSGNFLSFGGHPAAAGFKLSPEAFKKCSCLVTKYVSQGYSEWDAEMVPSNFEEAYREYTVGIPYGEGNPAPRIRCDINLAEHGVYSQMMKGNSLKITAGKGTFVSFHHPVESLQNSSRFTMIGGFKQNVWNGIRQIQFVSDEVTDTPPRTKEASYE